MARDSETAAVRWIHAVARDSEQLIIIREQTGDGGSRETDPRGGSDAGQLELWPGSGRETDPCGSQRLKAADYPDKPDNETTGRQIHAADQILNRWNHGRTAARDSEQMTIIREQTGDGGSRETDPRGGSDTGQLEQWPETRRQQRP